MLEIIGMGTAVKDQRKATIAKMETIGTVINVVSIIIPITKHNAQMDITGFNQE